MHKSNAKKIPLERGAIPEAARRMGVPVQTAYSRWKRHHPETVKAVLEVLTEWENEFRQTSERLQKIANYAAR